jgi:hypothetical protein
MFCGGVIIQTTLTRVDSRALGGPFSSPRNVGGFMGTARRAPNSEMDSMQVGGVTLRHSGPAQVQKSAPAIDHALSLFSKAGEEAGH